MNELNVRCTMAYALVCDGLDDRNPDIDKFNVYVKHEIKEYVQ